MTAPVFTMEMTSRPGERRFYAELLTLLGAPHWLRTDIAQMLTKANETPPEANTGDDIAAIEIGNTLRQTIARQSG